MMKTKKINTTATILGDELHSSITDGIRDKNVLGFGPYKILTYKYQDIWQAFVLEQAKAATIEKAIVASKKSMIYCK